MKYMGNPGNIRYRSSWELSFNGFLDTNDKIIRWNSEIPISYFDLNGKSHNFFIDYYYEICVNGDPQNYKRVIAEIKPSNELIPPEKPINESGKKLESYEYAIRMHIRNKIKFSAAVDFAKNNGMEFIIITEKHLKKMRLIK
jgi:hypothetical protein